MTATEPPSTEGTVVNLFHDARGFYYFITPFGTTRTFATKFAARAFARRHKWIVVEEAKR